MTTSKVVSPLERRKQRIAKSKEKKNQSSEVSSAKKETKSQKSEPKPKVSKVISTCGFLAWWEFKGAEVTPINLQEHLNKYESLKSIVVPNINKMSALTQCIREFRYSKDIRVRAEVASQDDNELNINLLERVKVDKKKVEWHRCENLIFEIKEETWLSKGESDKQEVIKARISFIESFNKRSAYLDHNYIRPYVLQKKLKDMGAISLRNRGGIFFVPESKENNKNIMDLSNFSDDLNGLEFLVCSMQADNHTKKSLGSQVKKSLTQRLAELQETLNNWKQKTRNVRQDSLTQVMEEFSEIRNLTEIYQESLSFRSDELLKELKDIESIATDLILDQKTRGRGVSGAVVKRYKKMIEDNPSSSEDGKINVPFKYMEDRAWPDCSFISRFYKSHNNSSGYKALANLGYFGEADEDKEILTLVKI